MSYESFRQSWGPTWLKSAGGQVWQGAHGRFADKLVAQAKAAVLAQFPEVCPSDALPYLGSEIGIPRSPADTDASYGEKLRRAWDVWPFAGTPLGLLLAFEAAGYPAGQVIVVQQEANAFGLNTNTSLDSDQRLIVYDLPAGWWTFGGGRTMWNRFAVIFPDPNNLPTGWAAGAAAPPTGSTSPTLGEVNGMIRLVQKWKRAGSIFMGITICTQGQLVGWPLRNVNDGGTVGPGSAVLLGPNLY